ncbi:MAG: NAD-dependent epimerase/dehydratase family protein [Pseudomonadota bacterium]
MTVLVTGAAGFLGGHIVRALKQSGRSVRGLDLAFPFSAEFETFIGSVLDPDLIRTAMQGVSGVVHAAAIAQLWTPGRFDYDRVNVVGTCRVLAAARRAGVPTVLVSSYTTMIGRDTSPGDIVDETSEITPNRLLGRYPRSKRQAELVAMSAAETGQSVSIVCPTAPLGRGDHNFTPPTALIRDLVFGRLPALLDCTLNLLDAEAIAAATVAALDHGRSGQRYMLAGEDIRLSDLATEIAALSGRPAPRHRVPLIVALAAARVEAAVARVTKRPPEAPLTGVRLAARPVGFDTKVARAELGFAPRPVRELLPEVVDWISAKEGGSGQP